MKGHDKRVNVRFASLDKVHSRSHKQTLLRDDEAPGRVPRQSAEPTEKHEKIFCGTFQLFLPM